MDKSCHSSGDSSVSSISTHTNPNPSSNSATTAAAAPGTDPNATTTTTATTRDQFLRHLNKLSHKISKPTTAASGSISRRPPSEPPIHLRPPPPAPPLQQQPPVYNINKSDFRDVVQKLTGSPAHERIQAPPAQPPPIHAPKLASSRLQRIRPPPLAQLSNLPPPLLNCAAGGFIRQPTPHSPLPPLPTCHAAAESPISAYMRFLHSSFSAFDSDPKLPPPPPPHPTNPPPSSADSTVAIPPPPSSPLPFGFGCLPSPKSPCPLFSPTGTGPLGFPQLPISPGVPSPKWKDL